MTTTTRQNPPRTGAPEDVASYDARELTGELGQAYLTLDGQLYTLRITRAGKLILTK
ncbi:hypothetical protein P775_27940 [Puniceibacterium antarcticum]|uniref:Hemin uptake protein hemP n=1 Tax=Puniceibacterium antarcticum TaxID=1206336 RepID=A0A2G8QWY7_9RHOB|nr:hemin uptake protein HemP [Puniceibacterium antarcticum]PIL13799.1 hypothetical protein P775_27940 [Puniceibacterium antarcticum]